MWENGWPVIKPTECLLQGSVVWLKGKRGFAIEVFGLSQDRPMEWS